MTTFQHLRIYNTRERAWLRLAVPAAFVTLPLAAGLVGLAGTVGLLSLNRSDLWFGSSMVMASGALAFSAFRFESLMRRYRIRRSRHSSTEVLRSAGEFVDRLEELARESSSVSVLDLTNFTRHLAAAPAFLSARCAPQKCYRQISNVASEHEFQDLVRLIRRSPQAEKGTYYGVHKDPAFFGSTSFCLVEREDGFHVFLIPEKGEGPTQVVLVRDDAYGRCMLGEYDRLCARLEAEDGPPLFQDGRLDPARESRLLEACAEPGEPGHQLYAA